ncbi:Chromatin structure remodeling complex protein sfh1 [Dispira parvispora]|uniref:Chromatin structure remodeling complex protein sfh1 n=1 Tax=Dispira parvispora TaxID=1520584 RepID=A0A9W8B0I0_9FUNG|nr:Chromatin structure remodeling complex protein sfh1 [Dispira parvispora]
MNSSPGSALLPQPGASGSSGVNTPTRLASLQHLRMGQPANMSPAALLSNVKVPSSYEAFFGNQSSTPTRGAFPAGSTAMRGTPMSVGSGAMAGNSPWAAIRPFPANTLAATPSAGVGGGSGGSLAQRLAAAMGSPSQGMATNMATPLAMGGGVGGPFMPSNPPSGQAMGSSQAQGPQPHMGMAFPGQRHPSMVRPPPSHAGRIESNVGQPTGPKPNTFTTYAARLKDGSTAMVIPQDWVPTRGKSTRRSGRRFRHDSSSEDESDFSDQGSHAGKSETRTNIMLGQPPTMIDGQVISRVMKSTNHLYLDDISLWNMAEKPEHLVPIRIDLDLESTKLHDTFLWNVNEAFMTPEKFAQLLCMDLDIAQTPHAESISQSIRAQLDEYATFLELQSTRHMDITQMNRSELEEQHAEFRVEYYSEPIRVPITLELHVGKHLLRDKFEWDLTTTLDDENLQNMPEIFARSLCAELGLGGEFVTLVTHSIREQLLRHQRERLDHEIETGTLASRRHANKSQTKGTTSMAIDDEWEVSDIPSEQVSEGITTFRNWSEGDAWVPVIETLSQEEIEKILMDKERSIRRLRRETSRLLQSARQRRSSPHPSRLGSGANTSGVATPNPGYTPLANRMSSGGGELSTVLATRSGNGPIHSPARSPSGQRSSRLDEEEKAFWRCTHCNCDGYRTTVVRKGPQGTRTLCNACGLAFTARGHLPEHRKNMYSRVSDD